MSIVSDAMTSQAGRVSAQKENPLTLILQHQVMVLKEKIELLQETVEETGRRISTLIILALEAVEAMEAVEAVEEETLFFHRRVWTTC